MPMKAVRAHFISDRSETRDFCPMLKSLVAYIILRERKGNSVPSMHTTLPLALIYTLRRHWSNCRGKLPSGQVRQSLRTLLWQPGNQGSGEEMSSPRLLSASPPFLPGYSVGLSTGAMKAARMPFPPTEMMGGFRGCYLVSLHSPPTPHLLILVCPFLQLGDRSSAPRPQEPGL